MTLEIQHTQSLQRFNSFGLDVTAERLALARSEDDVREALALCRQENWPLTVLGGGSNVVLSGDVSGLTMIVAVPGVEFVDDRVTAGAGESWHTLVMASIEQGLSGLENLALIPGSVGAAPIQNIGAYGAELEQVFESLTAIDRTTGERVTLDRSQCGFGYRDSIFKGAEADRYVITTVTLRLSREFKPNLEYAALAAALDREADLTPAMVADAVMSIRESRLPDPGTLGNAGSFFKNPVVEATTFTELQRAHGELPHWRQDDGTVKVSAGWLIDQCGLRGKRHGGAGVFERHALVLVNADGATPADVLALAGEIADAVRQRFDITLDIEPRLVGPASG